MRNLHTRVARLPGRSPLDVYDLVPGEHYRVTLRSGAVPLVFDPDPDDPLAEIARFEPLLSGTVLRILGRQDMRLGSFYRVSLDDGRRGYVNILALLGATVEKVTHEETP